MEVGLVRIPQRSQECGSETKPRPSPPESTFYHKFFSKTLSPSIPTNRMMAGILEVYKVGCRLSGCQAQASCPTTMARSNPLLSLSFVLLAVTAVTSAHPFRRPRLERRSLHRQFNHGVHRRSDDRMDLLQVKENLRSRYASTFALPISTLERLRTDTLSSIEVRQQPNESATHVVDLPFTVEQLQEKLQAFMQSLSDDLAAMFGSDPNSSPSSASSPAGSTSTNELNAATGPPTTVSSGSIPTSPIDSPSIATSSSLIPLLTQLTTLQSAVTHTSTIQQPTWTSSIQSNSIRPTSSANRSDPYVFDPMAGDNVVVYYGQTTQTSTVPLTQICADPEVDVVILAFVTTLFGPGGWPTLNMGPHCWAASAAQSQAGATSLIDCVSDGFADHVQQCQDVGKKVMLSLGGALGYSDTTIPSDRDAEMLASKLWNLFLGGTEIPATNAIRPFGNVVLDGIDIGEHCK